MGGRGREVEGGKEGGQESGEWGAGEREKEGRGIEIDGKGLRWMVRGGDGS